MQVEAQEAIVRDLSNLCDVAEAMCNAQEEQLKQSLIDLPIWASPHELMASLCDDWVSSVRFKILIFGKKNIEAGSSSGMFDLHL